MKRSAAERISDGYIIMMLLVFPLFFGFSGYAEITLSKFVFFVAATCAYLVALTVSVLCDRRRRTALAAPQYFALAAAAVALLSWLCCAEPGTSLLGAGRYDGLVSVLLYLLVFFAVSAFSVPKPLHVHVFAVSTALCLLVALLQLTGANPLRLFPGTLTYFDAGIRYSGVYLGTLGNTNVLDAVLALALPLFLARFVTEGGGALLLPVALTVPVLQKAGGSGGLLALALAALALPPLLLTDLARVRRALRAAALVLVMLALSLLWQPEPGRALRFAAAKWAVPALVCGAVAFALSLLPLPASFSPKARTLRRVFLALSCAAALVGLAYIWFYPCEGGTLYELRQFLRGHAEDSFGSSRVRIWRACLALVPGRPLLGYGPGMLAKHLDIPFERYVPETGRTLRSYADNAHNVYLAALVNTGALGLLSQLALLWQAGAAAVRKRNDTLALALALAALCGAAHGCFGLGLCLSEPLFWLLLGLLCTREK